MKPVPRRTTRPLTIDGAPIAAGALVSVCVASANPNDAVFGDDARQCRLDRPAAGIWRSASAHLRLDSLVFP